MISVDGWAVVNDLGHVVPCMDGGKTLHHVAVWATVAQAERFRQALLRLQPGPYTIERAVVLAVVTEAPGEAPELPY